VQETSSVPAPVHPNRFGMVTESGSLLVRLLLPRRDPLHNSDRPLRRFGQGPERVREQQRLLESRTLWWTERSLEGTRELR
jgi:hypothetical protein